MDNKLQKKLYTIEEFSEAYCLSRSKVFNLLKEKKLKSVRVGSRRMIRLEDGEAWKNSLEKVE